MRLQASLGEIQTESLSHLELFTVTAGNAKIPPGLSVLEALCGQKGVRFGEDHYTLYTSLCGIVVKAGNRVGMLNNMSGKRGDAPLMKASANGNAYMVKLLLKNGVRDPHLGFIVPPF